MSTLEDLDDLERHEKEEKKDDDRKKEGGDGKKADGDEDMKDAESEEEQLDEEILNSSTRDIIARRRLLENDMRIMKSEFQRLTHEKANMNEKIKDNLDKIENNRYGWLIVLYFCWHSFGSANCWTQTDTDQAAPIPCW